MRVCASLSRASDMDAAMAADACARYLCKGRKAAVEGRLQARSYQAQDGGKRHVTEVIAEQVEFLPSAQRESGGSAGRWICGLRRGVAVLTGVGEMEATKWL